MLKHFGVSFDARVSHQRGPGYMRLGWRLGTEARQRLQGLYLMGSSFGRFWLRRDIRLNIERGVVCRIWVKRARKAYFQVVAGDAVDPKRTDCLRVHCPGSKSAAQMDSVVTRTFICSTAAIALRERYRHICLLE